jgi:hypothetical protein
MSSRADGARGAGCGRSWQQASAYAHRMSVAVERSHNDAHARHSTCGEGRIKCTGTAVQYTTCTAGTCTTSSRTARPTTSSSRPVHVELLDLLLVVVATGTCRLLLHLLVLVQLYVLGLVLVVQYTGTCTILLLYVLAQTNRFIPFLCAWLHFQLFACSAKTIRESW